MVGMISKTESALVSRHLMGNVDQQGENLSHGSSDVLRGATAHIHACRLTADRIAAEQAVRRLQASHGHEY
jgi:hypothetical protein